MKLNYESTETLKELFHIDLDSNTILVDNHKYCSATIEGVVFVDTDDQTIAYKRKIPENRNNIKLIYKLNIADATK